MGVFLPLSGASLRLNSGHRACIQLLMAPSSDLLMGDPLKMLVDINWGHYIIKVKQWGCFPLTHHLGGDFDHGKIMRPDKRTEMMGPSSGSPHMHALALYEIQIGRLGDGFGPSTRRR